MFIFLPSALLMRVANYKSMGKNSTITDWRQVVIFILCALMIVALFLSRAMLASGMILFFFFSFFHRNISEHLRNFFSSPLLWGMSLLFFIPLVSGWWSDDKHQWVNILRIKLPLLVMPLAFAGPIQLSKNQW